MISRIELVEWAAQNRYEVTDLQIERWHKEGIIPRPFRDDQSGKVGSEYFYPDTAKANLLLALQSDSRTLNGRLLDVWFGGGQVSADDLRPLLLKPVEALHNAVKSPGKTMGKIYAMVKKAPFWTKNLDDFLATYNLMLHVLSPREEDVLWGYEAPGERAITAIADEVLGADRIRTMDPDTMSETSEDFWNDAKRNMNAGKLLRAVKTATDADFEAILPYLRVIEPWVLDLSEVATLADKRFRMFGLFKDMPISRYVMRVLFMVMALAFHKNPETTETIRDATDTWAKELPRLRAYADYLRYMKKHPKLRKRKGWEEYFKICGEETLADIRRYHQEYVSAHPDFLAMIGQTC